MTFTSRIMRLYRWGMLFIYRGLWEPTTGTMRRLLVGIAQRVILTTRLFLREKMQFRASALTYSTLLSVVPVLAIVFAIAKGFGLDAYTEQWIRDNIMAKPEVTDTLVGFVRSYLSHTQGGIFLGFGLIMLLWTLFNLTDSIETTFNQIWQVHHPRTILRKVTDYTAIFFLLPIFIVVTSGLTIFAYSAAREVVPDVLMLRPAAQVLVQSLPYFLLCLFFTALFAFMPNTQVKLRSALTAGIPTGILFQLLQVGYIHSQVWLSSYNAIYGSFAALPLLMLMCQLAWTITLFGATLCYVDQNMQSFYYGQDEVDMSRLDHDCLCVRLATAVCKRFATLQPALSAREVAENEHIHLRIVTEVLYDLTHAGVLTKVTDEAGERDATYVPACDIQLISVPFVLSALDRAGGQVIGLESRSWRGFTKSRREMFGRAFSDAPLHELSDETGLPEVQQDDSKA